ncbi:hypothetical protein D3C71_1891110 [compost metagenome]
MYMRIDEARQHQPSADRLLLPTRPRRNAADGDNAAISDPDILKRGLPSQARIAQHEIEGNLK